MVFQVSENRRGKQYPTHYIDILDAPNEFIFLEQTEFLNAEVQYSLRLDDVKANPVPVNVFLNGYYFSYIFDPAFAKPEAKPFVTWIEKMFERYETGAV